jgi:hypothetical protein
VNIIPMDLTTLTSSDLRNLQALLEKKENLLAQVKQINAALQGFGESPAATGGRKPATGAKPVARAPRGALKAKVIAAIQAAGKNGIHIRELARKIGVKERNLSVWFFSTGKAVKQIKRIKPATYAWSV